MLRSISALSAVFFAAIVIAACGGMSGNTVVEVHGKPITKATYGHWLKIAGASLAASEPGQSATIPDPPAYKKCVAGLKAAEPKPKKGQPAKTTAELKAQCKQEYEALKTRALGFLISTEWVIGQAQEDKVSVSDKEVMKEYNSLRKQQYPKEKDFKKFLASTNETVSDLLLRVKVEMLSEKLREKIAKKAEKPPTKAEIKKYYDEHKSDYGHPERRNLNIILTKKAAEASSAKSEIEAGTSFASVAKRVSIEPASKNKGGSLPEVAKGQEQKALDEAVFSAKTGVLTGPVTTPFGAYIFEVTKVLPAVEEPLSKVEATIKQQLTAEKQQNAFTAFLKSYKKRWTARTECRAEYMVEDCKGYKAPKPAAPATPTTPSTSTSTTVSSSASTSNSASKTK